MSIKMNDIERAKIAINKEEYDKVIQFLLPLAKEDDAEAQYLLGYLYFTSADVTWVDSMKWLEKAASQNHPDACYYLSISAQLENGDVMFGHPKDEDHKELLLKAARLGSADAQRDVGCFYAIGEYGFPRDENQGRMWYEKAAKQNHPDAQYNYGLMLLHGEGGPKNVADGIEWLRKCASQENDEPMGECAAEILSEIYSEGLFGVNKNLQEAEYWESRAEFLKKIWAEKMAERNLNEDLYSAIVSGPACWQTEVVKSLIEEGADVNTMTEDQCPFLYASAFYGLKEITELLINNGANIHVRHPDSDATPLHAAAYNGHKEVVELLIAKGAYTDAKTKDGWTAGELALRQGHTEIAELLNINCT